MKDFLLKYGLVIIIVFSLLVAFLSIWSYLQVLKTYEAIFSYAPSPSRGGNTAEEKVLEGLNAPKGSKTEIPKDLLQKLSAPKNAKPIKISDDILKSLSAK